MALLTRTPRLFGRLRRFCRYDDRQVVDTTPWGYAEEKEFKPDYTDLYNKHRQVVSLGDKKPIISEGTFVAPCATITGQVELWDSSSVWYKAVLRAERSYVRVGAFANIQDGTVVTDTFNDLAEDHVGSCVVGHYVTVGHNCVLRACTVEDESLIGMNSVLCEGSNVERFALLGAGSVLHPGQNVGAGELWFGNPARYIRDLTENEKRFIRILAKRYAQHARTHSKEFHLPHNFAYVEAEKLGLPVGWLV